MTTWSSGGIGNIWATSFSALSRIGAEHAGREADVDARLNQGP